MRCDGVVEYIYEWYSYRVFGNDTQWDVTKNDIWISTVEPLSLQKKKLITLQQYNE